MAWPAIRDAVQAVLETVAITEPVAQTIVRVYEWPTETVAEHPAILMYPAGVTVERHAGQHRILHYALPLELVVHDEDQATANHIVESYRDALVNAFDTELKLGGEVTMVNGPDVQAATARTYGRTNFVGFDALLVLTVSEARSMSV